MGTLDDYGLTNLTQEDTIKEKFLENVNEGLENKKISLIPSFPEIELPITFPENVNSAMFFNPEEETISEHEEKYARYHEIVFPMVEQIANVLNLSPPGPKAPPIQDPTTPILAIINAISIPGLDVEYVLKPEVMTYILSNAKDFISASAKLNSDYTDMYELISDMPELPIDKEVIKEKLENISIDVSLPEVEMPSISIPVPPFIDLPSLEIPVMSLEGIGIIDFIIELINAAVNTLISTITSLASPIKIQEFIASLKDGIIGVVNFIIDIVAEPIMIVLEKFSTLKDQLGWISTIGVIIKYTLAMIIMSITTFILGPGLITLGVGHLFGII
jgi:hypothetical protein